MNTTRIAAVAIGAVAAAGALTATALAFEADDDTVVVDPIAWSWHEPAATSWLGEVAFRVDADLDARLDLADARTGVRQVRGRLTAVRIDDDATSVVIDGTTYRVAASAADWGVPSIDVRTRAIRVRATLDADGEVIRLRRA